MKTNYKKAILAVATSFLALTANSQVATLYTFAQSAGTYNAITGGTVYGSITSDDQVFIDPAAPAGVGSGATGPGIPIGFNFMFNNLNFDRIGISNNGWIMFGMSSLGNGAINSNTGSNYTGLSATSTAPGNLQNRVGGFARDIQGQAGSELRVQTLGATPNQTCVIQWTGYRKFAATGDNFNFQIRLYETINVVENVYGSFVTNATTALPEIGLRGSSNADYNNRVTNFANPWSASIAGTVNNAAATLSTGIVPNVGQTYRWTPPQCSGTLTPLTALGNTSFVCPGGTSIVSLVNSYTLSGITYSWNASVSSAVGPYTVLPNTNGAVLTATGITAPTWYQSVATCLNSSSNATSTAFEVQVAGTTISNIPYLENFEGLITNNQLPNCSWAASNLPTICQTYTTVNANNRIPHSGTKFAAFRFGTNTNGDYFYTNGLQLLAGVTYSAGAWYTTDGALGWNNFSVLLGSSQVSTGLVPIASVGPASGTFYQLLSGTFSVASSGVYYLAIKCVANSTPQFMSFDDVFVTIPCTLNAPTLTVSANTQTACSGTPVTITASGANSYTWSTGDMTSVISVTPNSNSSYQVTGLNAASGCTSSASQAIMVNPSPVISVFANSPSVCFGSSAQLSAGGASSYTWSNGASGPATAVSPTSTSSYVVIGSNGFGCTGNGMIQITVNPLPVVSVTTTAPNELCVGETAVLTAGGASTYQWMSANLFYVGSQVMVSPTVSTSYTLVGTSTAGCSGNFVLNQNVGTCTGLIEKTESLSGLKLYPNPTVGRLTIELNSNVQKTIVVSDLTGRMLLTQNSDAVNTEVDLSRLAAGIYYVKIISGNSFEVIKVVRE